MLGEERGSREETKPRRFPARTPVVYMACDVRRRLGRGADKGVVPSSVARGEAAPCHPSTHLGNCRLPSCPSTLSPLVALMNREREALVKHGEQPKVGIPTPTWTFAAVSRVATMAKRG